MPGLVPMVKRKLKVYEGTRARTLIPKIVLTGIIITKEAGKQP